MTNRITGHMMVHQAGKGEVHANTGNGIVAFPKARTITSYKLYGPRLAAQNAGPSGQGTVA